MIEIEGLVKRFGGMTAVDGVTFSASPGEIVGLLGLNGAGKTTTMRIVAGFMRPTEGRCRLDGVDVERNPLGAKRKLGYLPENVPLYPEMTVFECLKFVAGVRGLQGGRLKSALADIVGRCGLDKVRDKLIGTISRGYRQRTGLAAALVHEPPCVVLDEPTIGLDPVSVQDIRKLVHEVGRRSAVVLSTHLLHEVEMLCDRVVVLDRGKVVAVGSPDLVAAETAGPVLCECLFEGEEEVISSILSSDPKFEGFSIAPCADGLWQCRFRLQDGASRSDLIRTILDAELRLSGFTLLRPSLEDFFQSRSGHTGPTGPLPPAAFHAPAAVSG